MRAKLDAKRSGVPVWRTSTISMKECDYIDNKRTTWILRVQRMLESNGLRDGYCGTFSEWKNGEKVRKNLQAARRGSSKGR